MKKLLVIALLLLDAFIFAQQPGRVIFIDPGHGGRDPGAIGTCVIDGEEVVLKESHITLGIGKALREKILSAFPDIKVFLTREDDIDLSVLERMNRINSQELSANDTAIYVSIHVYWNFNPNLRGYGLYVNGNNAESLRLAQALSTGFSGTYEEQEIPFRGIFQRDFKTPDMPSVMLEMGNINSKNIFILYGSRAFERCADAILRGIAAYIAYNQIPPCNSVSSAVKFLLIGHLRSRCVSPLRFS